MAVVTPPAREPVHHPAPGVAAGPRSNRLVRVAAALAGAGVAYIVAADGTPAWQVVRLVAAVAATALVWRAVGGPERRHAALWAVAAGVLVLPVGVAIAVPHLAETGLHPIGAAGVAALAGGLVLLVGGGATLVRTTRRWRRVPVVAALVAVTFVALWSVGQAVGATNVPRTDLGSTTPDDRGLAYRDVEFPAADGVTLSGWYVPSSNGAAVVLLHGAGSTRSNVLDHAVVLARHGYGVLLSDARGHGRSDGRAMDFGWYGDDDMAGAVDFVAAQPDVDRGRIAAVGMSMGGEQAIGAAATDQRIRAVVAEGATTRMADDKGWLSEEHGLRGAVQERLDQLTYALTDLLTAAHPPVSLADAARAAAPREMLLVAAGSVPDEPRAADHVRSAAPETVDVWVVPHTRHTAGLDTHPSEWEARVVGFLDDALDVDTASVAR